MSSEVVTLEVRDHVAVATLNRPPVNAVNREMRDRIIEIFDAATDRDDIRVLVLTGQGRIFSAGADLKPGRTRRRSAPIGTTTARRARRATPSANAPSR